jgi:hypothetical protein
MEELYKKYLLIPEYSRFPRMPVDIYTSEWCVIINNSNTSSPVYRPYTFEEFKEAYNNKEDLKYYLTNKV